MRTVVIGGGLIGLCTAQALVEREQEVLVLEAREGVGLETSFANGGMLTPSLPEPWNGPGVFAHLLGSLFNPRASTRLRLRAVPSLVSWGIEFLKNATPDRYLAATRDNFRLACYSLQKTLEVTQRLDLAYDLSERGTLCIFEDAGHMAERTGLCKDLADLGLAMRECGVAQVIDIEPTLAPIRDRLVGGLWLPGDARGDAHLFCCALARAMAGQGVRIVTRSTVTRLVVAGGRVLGVATDAGILRADRVVVAAGVRSPALLETAGQSVPVKPAKGYSITMEGSTLGRLPDVTLLDDVSHTVINSFGDRLRIAGTAEFAGFDKTVTPARIDNLLRALDSVLPDLAAKVDRDAVKPWVGLRPMSSDGRAFIGPTATDGLFVNTGHGALGWTMAMGSAHVLADQIIGRQPEVDAQPFRIDR